MPSSPAANPWMSARALWGTAQPPEGWQGASARGPHGTLLYAPQAGWLDEYPRGDYARRYWTLRANLGLAEQISQFVVALRPARWEALVERSLKRRAVYVHLLVAWEDGCGAWGLIDHGQHTVFAWAAALRYCALDARRRGGALLLAVSPLAFRRWAILALGRLLGGESLTILACGGDALTRGLDARWERLGEDWALRPAGAVARLKQPGAIRVARRRSSPIQLEPPCWAGPVEGLREAEWRALEGIAWCPLIGEGELSALHGASDFAELEAGGLIARAEGGGWVLSACGEALMALRDVGGEWSRRRAHLAGEARRQAGHTRAVYRFFARLRRDLEQLARATRPLEDGRPYYEWGVYHSELIAAHRYLRDGKARIYRPDGYGSIRVGTRWVRFFVELDGWLDESGRVGGRSVCSYQVWLEKLARRRDYRLSGWWALRYPDFPALLVVTTDARNLALIQAALVALGEAEEVRVALAEDVWRAGATARVWRAVSGRGAGEYDYLAPGFAQPGLVARGQDRPDALAAVARANALRAAAEAWAIGQRKRRRERR